MSSILVLTEDSKPATGGIAEYLHQLALALSVTHRVTMVTSVGGAASLNAGLPFHYREVPWFRSQVYLRGDDSELTRRLNTVRWRVTRRWRVRTMLRELLHEQHDATVVIGRVSRVTEPWLEACRDLGVLPLAFAWGRELLEEGIPQAARDVIGHWLPISEATATVLTTCGIPRDQMTVLLPAIGDVSSKDQSSSASHEPFVLSIGMLRPRKGIDLALRAFADISAQFPDLRYVVVGDGPEREPLTRLARDLDVDAKVSFVGEVDDATRDRLIHGCSLFVLPTRDVDDDMEGFGLVFLEAARAGKMAIAGRTGGVTEAILDGVTGLLVDTSGNAEPLAEAMRKALNNQALCAGMGSQAQRHVMRSFGWGARAQTLVTTLQLVRRGRLRAFSSGGMAPASRDDCRAAILGWVERAMGDGRQGVPAGYHVIDGWDAPYPEVTGYLIPTLLRESKRDGLRRLACVASAAGEWLVRTRLPSGAVCCKQWHAENTTPSVFNTAQVLEGWSALAHDGGEEHWLAPAHQAAQWLVREQESDGSWVRSAFNGCAHSYYARAAAVLAEFGIVTQCESYVDAARRALQWVVAQQRSDGWFDHADFTTGGAPTTHTIAYVLEGLLRGAEALDEPVFRESAAKAARVLRDIWADTQALPGRFIEGWQPVTTSRCLTGEAQIGAVWALLGDVTRAGEIADHLRASVRVMPEWPEISGGVAGSVPAWGDYDPYRYPTHAAKFALDLFAMI